MRSKRHRLRVKVHRHRLSEYPPSSKLQHLRLPWTHCYDVNHPSVGRKGKLHPSKMKPSMLPMTLYHQPIWPTATQPSNAITFVMQPTSCMLPTFNCFISSPLFELSFSYPSIVHCPTGQGNYLLTDSFESKSLSFYVIIHTQFRSANRATCRSVLENHELQWGTISSVPWVIRPVTGSFTEWLSLIQKQSLFISNPTRRITLLTQQI